MASVLSRGKMHIDHQQWAIEEALWENEARVWQKDLDAALAELKKLETVLRDERAALNAHAATVHGLRGRRTLHESLLADYERERCNQALIDMARKHEREAEKHLQQRHAHERVKQHLHTLMAYWRLFFKALSSGM